MCEITQHVEWVEMDIECPECNEIVYSYDRGARIFFYRGRTLFLYEFVCTYCSFAAKSHTFAQTGSLNEGTHAVNEEHPFKTAGPLSMFFITFKVEHGIQT